MVDQGLDDGVVGGVGVAVEREGALTLAVERRVSSRRDDPFLITKNNHYNSYETLQTVRLYKLYVRLPIKNHDGESGAANQWLLYIHCLLITLRRAYQ